MTKVINDWKDIYELPLKDGYVSEEGWFSGRIYDSKENFVFQFLIEKDKNQKNALEVINGEKIIKSQDLTFRHENGCVYCNDKKFLLIRGWGRLTGVGGYNLNEETAMKVQDIFTEFIVKQLNKRKP